MHTPRLSRSSAFSICLVAAAILSSFTAKAQSDVTMPGDLITWINGVNDGDSSAAPSPVMEAVEHAIDNVGQKYLNFYDLGSGFVVQPSVGLTLVNGLRIYTANDAEERDPASYLLEGGDSLGALVWTTIASGPLALPSGRNPGGPSGLDEATSYYQFVTFANDTAYEAYRLTFPTLKNAAAANSMQVGEVEFTGVVVPEPSATAAVMGIAGLGWAICRRRQHAASPVR